MFFRQVKALKLWNSVFLWIYAAAVCVLLLFCGIQYGRDRGTLSLEGHEIFSEGSAAESVLYGDIALKPGVYEVRLAYRSDRDYVGVCTMRDDSLSAKALRTNGEHLYRGLDCTGYTLWLFRPSQHLQLVVSYGGEGMLETGELTIVNTGRLWSMLFVLGICLGAGGILLMAIWAYDRQYGILPQRKKSFLFLLLITLVSSIPQFHTYLLGGADLTYHLQRIEGVKDGILSGQFPVRIEPEWLYGHGYANGVFYCNALLYLPGLLRLAGFDVTSSYNLFCIALNFATAVISWYSFGKLFDDERIGLMCSALYTMSIFRIYKLYMVGGVGEGSAITFLPLVFYGIYKIFAKDPKSRTYPTVWLPLTFGCAGLIQSHVLTCEITAFVCVLICIVCIRRLFDPKVFMALAKGLLGAAGISLWYLVPFLDYYLTQDMHIRHISERTIQERGLSLEQLTVSFWNEDVSRKLMQKGQEYVEFVSPGWLCLLALGIFFVLWCSRRIRGKEKLEKAALFSAFAAVVLLFMTLRIFPWDGIQKGGRILASLVGSLQFPYRFMGCAMVFLITVFGYLVWRYRKKKGAYLAGTLLTLLSLAASVYMMCHAVTEMEHYHLYNEEGMGSGYISGAEYLVEGTDDLLLTYEAPTAGEGVSLSEYRKDYLHINFSCANDNAGVSYVELPVLLYKGYRACTDSGEKLKIAHGDNHRLRVILPAGFWGNVEVRFACPVSWRLGEIISLLSLGVIFAVMKKKSFTDR